MNKLFFAIGIFSLAAITSCAKQNNLVGTSDDLTTASASTRKASADLDVQAPSSQILVKFKKEVSEEGRQRAFGHIAGKLKEKVHTKLMKQLDQEGVYVLNTLLSASEAVGKLKSLPDVEFAEPDYIVTTGATARDPYFTGGNLWGMGSDYGIKATSAWSNNHTGSKSVFVGIIDEGVEINHQDLLDNIWTNPYDWADGIDNDGNGYIDDVHGWDFHNNDNTVYDGGASGTEDRHGTHVAGTIGAKSNSSGVVGVNWNVTMIPCKFMGTGGGYISNAIKALDYLTDLKKTKGLRIVASNNSWSGGGYSAALYDAIERSNAANILFVAAAGNGGSDFIGDNNDVTPTYPSCYPNANVISVAAITSTGKLSSFSNYGAKTVDIAAPGSDIYSTMAGGIYAPLSGTSMATPHVTGAVALYAATKTTATASTIKSAIFSNASSSSALSGKCVTGKRLNVSRF